MRARHISWPVVLLFTVEGIREHAKHMMRRDKKRSMDQLCYIMKTAAAALSVASVPGGSAFSAEKRDKRAMGKAKSG